MVKIPSIFKRKKNGNPLGKSNREWTDHRQERLKDNIISVLSVELHFFINEYSIEKELEKWASTAKNPNNVSSIHGVMKEYVKRLRKQETKAQMDVSVSKLKSLTAIPFERTTFPYNPDHVPEVNRRINEMEVEAHLIYDSVEQLGAEIDKKTKDVDWDKVNNEILPKMKRDFQTIIGLSEAVEKSINDSY